LLTRGLTSGRSDDNQSSIEKRLMVFESESMQVIEYFQQQKRVKLIDAEKNLEEVQKSTFSFFEQ
jgi:UMP-CMP kinase